MKNVNLIIEENKKVVNLIISNVSYIGGITSQKFENLPELP